MVDATFMSKSALLSFLATRVEDARSSGVLFSLHMKATMMKVSDPIIFGHAVRVFFRDVFTKHGETLDGLGVDVNNGLGDLVSKIAALPADQKAAIEADIAATYACWPRAGDGQLRQGHHKPPCAVGCHHRCLDARDAAHERMHVEHRGQDPRHQGGHP